jgi:predicted transcriptional regulator of viral defense system
MLSTMSDLISYNYLEDFTDDLRSKGRYSFSLEEARTSIDVSDEALKKALNRVTNKGKILPVRKGFYLVIPPEYSTKHVLPPSMFIAPMMAYLNKPYYVGLLSAAAFYSASHQAPQEFFVMTVRPPLRSIRKSNLKINFIIKSRIDASLLVDRKTETGYLKVSCPELTAIDLVIYEEIIGGMNRCFTILSELYQEMKPSVLKQAAGMGVPLSVLQRLGYLLDLKNPGNKLSAAILDFLSSRQIRKVSLKPGKKISGFQVDKKWKIIKNVIPESDL